MKITVKILIVLLLIFEPCSCTSQNGNRIKPEDNINKSSSEPITNSSYELIQKVAWDESETCSIEATLLNSRIALIDLPKNNPKHIFQIRELHTGKILFKEEDSESAVSLKMVETAEGEKLILLSLATGAADVARAYLIKCDSSKEVFDEAYRDVFWYVNLYENDKSRFLIFVADNMTEFDNQLMVQEWEWNGTKFQLNGAVPYNEFIKNLNRNFTKKGAQRKLQED